ncbi:hypothetical protein D3C87_1970410 [compost metagenome]
MALRLGKLHDVYKHWNLFFPAYFGRLLISLQQRRIIPAIHGHNLDPMLILNALQARQCF